VRVALGLTLLLGCGRVAFDPLTDATPIDAYTGPPRVLLLGEAAFRSTALFDAWLAAYAASVTKVDRSITITPAVFVDVDIVVTGTIFRTYTADESTALYDFVAAGHGLVAITGYDGYAPEVDWFSSLVTAFGAGAVITANSNGPVRDLQMHPVTAGLVELPFFGGFEVSEPPSATPLGRINGTLVAAAAPIGRGRVVIWGDEWVMIDDYWTTNTLAMFWTQALGWVWPTS
jgi:hypothetical protein